MHLVIRPAAKLTIVLLVRTHILDQTSLVIKPVLHSNHQIITMLQIVTLLVIRLVVHHPLLVYHRLLIIVTSLDIRLVMVQRVPVIVSLLVDKLDIWIPLAISVQTYRMVIVL